ncbi:UDP-2,4-diacetamido-2,4,6-trideoxy-beta-L-altropyranose hydrolase [Nitratireductor soli]|uniref:UDP-2,4-diacetamido-2,4, 6-trideoxy-beta-L-altropyranose hydrolase n=1 Tax=Nitratireductor soli TaxID=1670619 RepID=UPI0009E27AA3|nr:UDP-2,4-diacetamido-2,4,6-trideoxy-beta-L-altropyranose hydrolase [Nitratireductor soli]
MMEKQKVRVAFRADASFAIGTGHVMRCLTLADALREQGAEIRFICREHDGHLCALIEEQGFDLHRLEAPGERREPAVDEPAHAAWVGVNCQQDADETLSALDDFRPDWLVIDHYGLDARWENRLRDHVGKIMVIDDLADRMHDCDVLLDQNLVAGQHARYGSWTPEACVLLLGPAYALLQPVYARLRKQAVPREGAVRRVLVFFGGVDKDGLTLKAVEAFLMLDRPEVTADIVLSASSPFYGKVAARLAGHSRLRLHDRVPSLAPLMLEADLAIGAGGATSWERLCLGLPSLVVTVAENQRPIAEELASGGFVDWLGHSDSVDVQAIADALGTLISTGLDAAWSRKCLEVVDGLGVDRVSSILMANRDMPLVIRPAELGDETLLLEWANDPATRRNAFNLKPISADDYRNWFRARLQDTASCVFYIAETELGFPVGQIRFDQKEPSWEISYSIGPAYRGRGLGRKMLATAIERALQDLGNVQLLGQVKPDNLASQGIFDSLGFSLQSHAADRYVYERRFNT